jgi:hypothetical protein
VMRRWGVGRRSDKTLTDLALRFNRKLQGWINYYGKFYLDFRDLRRRLELTVAGVG